MSTHHLPHGVFESRERDARFGIPGRPTSVPTINSAIGIHEYHSKDQIVVKLNLRNIDIIHIHNTDKNKAIEQLSEFFVSRTNQLFAKPFRVQS